MDQFLHTASLLSASASGALVSAIWEGSVLAAVVLLCLRLFPGLSAATRSVIWLNVFLLLVLLHFLPALVNRGSSTFAFHASPLQLDPRWSIAVAAAWAALSLARGIQQIGRAHV